MDLDDPAAVYENVRQVQYPQLDNHVVSRPFEMLNSVSMMLSVSWIRLVTSYSTVGRGDD